MASVNRLCLHIFNLLFFIGALGVIAVSFFLYKHLHQITSLLDDNYNLKKNYKSWIPIAPWISFGAAVLVSLIPVCGFMCALKKSKNFLILYTVVLIFGILTLITGAVLVFQYVDENSTDQFVSDAIRDIFDLSEKNPNVAAGFNDIEESLHCCGAELPGDYRKHGRVFSKACCGGRTCENDDATAEAKMGCSKVAGVKTTEYIMITYVTIFATCILGVFAMIFALITIIRLKIKPYKVKKETDLDSIVEEKTKIMNNKS